MTDTQYEVVFQGRLVEGFSAADVKANVARLFKASPQQVEQMFSGKRVVIRNQLDQETALKYQALLRKNGAICTIDTMKPAGAPVGSASASNGTSVSGTSVSGTTAAPAPSQTLAAAPAKPNPFLSPASEPKVPASVTGRLPVAGKRVDAILSQVDLRLDPVGVTLSPPRPTQAKVPDISHLSMAPVGATLSDPRDLPPPIVPDVDHLSIAPPGTRLSDPDANE